MSLTDENVAMANDDVFSFRSDDVRSDWPKIMMQRYHGISRKYSDIISGMRSIIRVSAVVFHSDQRGAIEMKYLVSTAVFKKRWSHDVIGKTRSQLASPWFSFLGKSFKGYSSFPKTQFSVRHVTAL